MDQGTRREVSASAAAGTASGRESGQALLELALVTPILILLILAIFQFAYVLETQIGLTNAVREAARRAATSLGVTNAFTVEQLMGDGGSNPGLLADNIPGYEVGRVDPNPPDVRICTFPVGGETNYRVDISVTYNHPIFFPIPGTSDLATLTAATPMRIEQFDPAPAVDGPCSAAWP
ncbi:MAG TPA: TadE/TadG family type IV pilus assembly protein [Candidatus Deferrimicrobiaceae bacterium]|nr:TadE/TadG family type IV pilus assembly protein [Candidatus Deferrimicrobiaceae bacterium]